MKRGRLMLGGSGDFVDSGVPGATHTGDPGKSETRNGEEVPPGP